MATTGLPRLHEAQLRAATERTHGILAQARAAHVDGRVETATCYASNASGESPLKDGSWNRDTVFSDGFVRIVERLRHRPLDMLRCVETAPSSRQRYLARILLYRVLSPVSTDGSQTRDLLRFASRKDRNSAPFEAVIRTYAHRSDTVAYFHTVWSVDVVRDALSRHFVVVHGDDRVTSSHLIAAAGTARELVRALATEKAIGEFPVAASAALGDDPDRLGMLLLLPALRRALRVASTRQRRRIADDLGKDFAESHADDDDEDEGDGASDDRHRGRASSSRTSSRGSSSSSSSSSLDFVSSYNVTTSTSHQRRNSPAASHNEDVAVLFRCAFDSIAARSVVASAADEDRPRLAVLIDDLARAYRRVTACLDSLPTSPPNSMTATTPYSSLRDRDLDEDDLDLEVLRPGEPPKPVAKSGISPPKGTQHRPSAVALSLRVRNLQPRARALCGCFCASRMEVKILADMLLRPEFDEVVADDSAALEEAVAFDADEGRRAIVVLKSPQYTSPSEYSDDDDESFARRDGPERFASPTARRGRRRSLSMEGAREEGKTSSLWEVTDTQRIEPAWRDARRARAITRRYLRRVLVDRCSSPSYLTPTQSLSSSAKGGGREYRQRSSSFGTSPPTMLHGLEEADDDYYYRKQQQQRATAAATVPSDSPLNTPFSSSPTGYVPPSRRRPKGHFATAAAEDSLNERRRRSDDYDNFQQDSYEGSFFGFMNENATIPGSMSFGGGAGTEEDEDSESVVNTNEDNDAPTALLPGRRYKLDDESVVTTSSRSRSQQPTIVIQNSTVVIKKYASPGVDMDIDQGAEEDEESEEVVLPRRRGSDISISKKRAMKKRMNPVAAETYNEPGSKDGDLATTDSRVLRRDKRVESTPLEPAEPPAPTRLPGPSEPSEVKISMDQDKRLASENLVVNPDYEQAPPPGLLKKSATESDRVTPPDDSHGPVLKPQNMPPPAEAPGLPATLTRPQVKVANSVPKAKVEPPKPRATLGVSKPSSMPSAPAGVQGSSSPFSADRSDTTRSNVSSGSRPSRAVQRCQEDLGYVDSVPEQSGGGQQRTEQTRSEETRRQNEPGPGRVSFNSSFGGDGEESLLEEGTIEAPMSFQARSGRPPRPPPSDEMRRIRSSDRINDQRAPAGNSGYAPATASGYTAASSHHVFTSSLQHEGTHRAGMDLLHAGVSVLKHCRHANPHRCTVSLCDNDTAIQWSSTSYKRRALHSVRQFRTNDGSSSSNIKIHEITDVKLGQATRVFNRNGNANQSARCFSILTRFRSLDLECDSQQQRDNLVAAVDFLQRHKDL